MCFILFLTTLAQYTSHSHTHHTPRQRTKEIRLGCTFDAISPIPPSHSITMSTPTNRNSAGSSTLTSSGDSIATIGDGKSTNFHLFDAVPIAILRPGEKITRTFTKSNPSDWCVYFERLCTRHNILQDAEKVDALISCLDSDSSAIIQPLLSHGSSYTEIKQLLIETYTAPLDERLQSVLDSTNLADVKPSQFLSRARATISTTDMSDSVLCEVLMPKLPPEVQIALASVVDKPLSEFAAAADIAMRRLPHSSLVSNISKSQCSSGPTNISSDSLALEVSELKLQMSQLLSRIDQLTSQASQNTQPTSSSNFSYRSNHWYNESMTRPFQRTSGNFRPWNQNSYAVSTAPGPVRYPVQCSSRGFAPPFCYYHRKFGPHARNCTQPCSWQGNI